MCRPYLFLTLALALGCSSETKLLDGIHCGEGTVLENDECVPVPDTGAPPEPTDDTGDPPGDETGDPPGDETGDPPTDLDHDGFTVDDGDCDDDDPAVNPDANEVCDGIDNNCNEIIDERDAEDARLWFRDADGDHFGNNDDTQLSCDPPEGYIAVGDDCDDDEPAVNPDATEVCDGIDNDCNGAIDDDTADSIATWFRDADGDDYGNNDDTIEACSPPEGYVAVGDDCDDDDPEVYPGATEFWYDGIDSDCGDDSDFDRDGDGHDSADHGGDDCDDDDDGINPDATEVCDALDTDEDCSGTADDSDPGTDPASMSHWFPDMDGDGLGDDSIDAIVQCEEPVMLTEADIDFEDFPDGTHVMAQYSELGVYFAGSAYGIVGGIAEGDPGSWALEGTAGSHFLGFNGGSYQETLSFDVPITDFSLDVSRSNGSSPGDEFDLRTYLDGSLVDSVSIALPDINTWVTVSVEDTWFDTIEIQGFGGGFHPYGIDRLVFDRVGALGTYTEDDSDCDDTDPDIGDDC
jgi:hypothetical protein